ncbi:MAG: metallophosphoesterase family protein [Myxococcota bacterium]
MSAVAHHLLDEEGRFQTDDALVSSHGRKRLRADPARFESWSVAGPLRLPAEDEADDRPSAAALRRYLKDKPWVAPARPICFLTDLHADREAFWRSLLDASLVRLPRDRRNAALETIADGEFESTPLGREVHYVCGGDLFDKGPANLPLLDALQAFRRLGVRFTLLCGNHDVRTFLGLRYAEAQDDRLAHLFVRMGQKTVTLFKEVFDAWIAGGDGRAPCSDEEARARLFPRERWFEGFRKVATGLVPEARIEKELYRVREKVNEFEARALALGLRLSDVVAALERCRTLFLAPEGRHAWIFREMQIAHREGSLLFAHAGVDDVAASWLAREGIDAVRERFRTALEEAPFELYNGPLGNIFRTKYRDLDLPLTQAGAASLREAGLYAIVHGHRNVYLGQHMNFRRGVLNFACDACVDRNTRRVEDLAGPGSATTLLAPDGTIYGLSADHPAIKVFDPAANGAWVTTA